MDKITLNNLERKKVQTKFGEKDVWNFKHDNKFFSAFIGDWNTSWRAGETIEGEITSRESNGKTYYSVKTPLSARGGGFGGGTQVLEGLLGSIDTKLSVIADLLRSQNAKKENSEDVPF